MFTQRKAEDPATGSATGATAEMLAQSPRVPDGETVLRFMQGVDMGRPSLLVARVLKRAGGVSAVHVGGRCVRAMEGSFYLTAAPA